MILLTGEHRPREASEMLHGANSAQNPAFRGLWIHSLKTSGMVFEVWRKQ